MFQDVRERLVLLDIVERQDTEQYGVGNNKNGHECLNWSPVDEPSKEVTRLYIHYALPNHDARFVDCRGATSHGWSTLGVAFVLCMGHYHQFLCPEPSCGCYL